MVDVCLVHMPFSSLGMPSLSLSIFKSALKEYSISSTIEYANLRFAQLIDLYNYCSIENSGILTMMSEMVFAGYLNRENGHDADEYFSWLETYGGGQKNLDHSMKIYDSVVAKVDKFIAKLAKDILSLNARIVATSSSFQQNSACLSIMKMIKRLDPSVVTIIGGYNCNCDSGVALANKMPFIDYVVSGEADDYFASFCKNILEKKNITDDQIPYGIIRRGMYSEEDDNLPFSMTHNLDTIPIPDYHDYFKAIRTYLLEDHIKPTLLIEASRGCWWNEKKPCTFCGLIAKSNRYRIKSTQRILDELELLSKTYQHKKFAFTDCILSKEHLKKLIPMLIELNAGYLLFCEVKSNLTASQIHDLRLAGFYMIQPGIESLNDKILTLMNKGNKAIKHLELLKNSKTYGMWLSWNILLGFPFEEKECYEELLNLIPIISHLQPPNWSSNIIFQKYSEYYYSPEKYQLKLEPAKVFKFIYRNDKLMKHMAYNYEPVDEKEKTYYYQVSHKDDIYAKVVEATQQWVYDFYHTKDRLQMSVKDNCIEIIDLRKISKKNLYALRGIDKEVYLYCNTAINKELLLKQLISFYSEEEIDASIRKLEQDKLILVINNDLLSLATNSNGLRNHDITDLFLDNIIF